MRRIFLVVGVIFGLFLVVRAVVEPFVIDPSDPSTYRSDWGGPNLAGVLFVHCVPGILAVVVLAILLRNRLRATRSDAPNGERRNGDPPR